MNKKTIRHIDVAGKRILARVDYNVPIDQGQNITDDARIRETLPTLNYLLDNNAAVVLMAHFGRPRGKIVDELRLTAVARHLHRLLGRPVQTMPDCVGDEVDAAVQALKPGSVLLLENLRFHAGEETNDPTFADQLARHGDVYVNDAFGAAHRAHASTAGVALAMCKLGKPCVAGLLMARELDFLGQLLESPQRPFVAILGGVKVSDKIGVIKNLLEKVDTLLIGGAMSFAFARARGQEVGRSYYKTDDVPIAARLLEQARAGGKDLRLPLDYVVADRDAEDALTQIVAEGAIPPDKMGMDIGPATVAAYAGVIEGARTVLWNGPMGRFEVTPFANGTREVAGAVARATTAGAITVIGGGDSAAAIKQMNLADRMTHISTGGGASLEFLEGRELPGVAALDEL